MMSILAFARAAHFPRSPRAYDYTIVFYSFDRRASRVIRSLMHTGIDESVPSSPLPPAPPVASRAIACLLALGVLAMLLPFAADPVQAYYRPDTEPGVRLWRSRNCAACHALYGLGGHLGPDLTNVISRRGRPYAAYVLSAGKGRMSAYALTESEGDALLDYLESFDALGQYPLKSPHAKPFGNNRQLAPSP